MKRKKRRVCLICSYVFVSLSAPGSLPCPAFLTPVYTHILYIYKHSPHPDLKLVYLTPSSLLWSFFCFVFGDIQLIKSGPQTNLR